MTILNDEPCLLDRDCVRIEDHVEMCGECSDNPATKVVMLDLLNNGMDVAIGSPLCAECAEEEASRLRESLPNSKENR